jgi:DNA repair protein RecO (recombination protein O)
LLPLPAFLAKGGQGRATPEDILAGLDLTAHFLEARVLLPREEGMPEARLRFRDLMARRATRAS